MNQTFFEVLGGIPSNSLRHVLLALLFQMLCLLVLGILWGSALHALQAGAIGASMFYLSREIELSNPDWEKGHPFEVTWNAIRGAGYPMLATTGIWVIFMVLG